jgi:hypothetical protein
VGTIVGSSQNPVIEVTYYQQISDIENYFNITTATG